MANSFLRILPFRPNREAVKGVRGPKIILPADDILDFEYPPQSSFSQSDIEATEDNFVSG